jgi:hypothetical protein
MMRWRFSLTRLLATLLLLATAAPVMAFGFCFSFGGKSYDRPRYGGYQPPYPDIAAPLYPAYGYSPELPVSDYGYSYYPPMSPYMPMPPVKTEK